MNERISRYVDLVREGLTPNVPASLRAEVFDQLGVRELDAYLARLRNSAA